MAFTSKYAVSLYENLAQFSGLSSKTFQDYTLDEFRALLGVPPGRYKTFGELNKHVIKPTVAEVNALARLHACRCFPTSRARRSSAIKIGWWAKESSRAARRPGTSCNARRSAGKPASPVRLNTMSPIPCPRCSA